VKELKLLRFTQDELRISLRAGSVKGKRLAKGPGDSSVAEFTVSEAEVLLQNDRG